MTTTVPDHPQARASAGPVPLRECVTDLVTGWLHDHTTPTPPAGETPAGPADTEPTSSPAAHPAAGTPAPAPAPVTALERTADKKVSFGLRNTGGKHTSVVANTHGLPAGISCPGRTTVCAGPSAALPTSELERIATAGELAAGGRGRETTWRHLLPQHGIDPTFPCYVVADLRRGTEENAAYRNWRALRPHLDDETTLTHALGATLDAFAAEAAQAAVPAVYRFHWDGDIPTLAYARAVAAAMHARPTITGWIYTRSLFAAPVLTGVPNLVTYLSVDAGNIDAARPLLEAHPRLHAAVLGTDTADTAALLDRLGRAPAPVCPVDAGKLPVVTAATRAAAPAGQEPAVGACALCQLCVQGRSDVRFTLRKTLFTPHKVSAPVAFDAAAGWQHHFGRRRPVGNLFDTLLNRLTGTGLPVQVTWRRTYITLAAAGQPLLRAQARGNRLLLVYPTRPDGTRLHRRLRDISGQRHQCPGVLELTVTDTRQLAEAVQLARQTLTADEAA